MKINLNYDYVPKVYSYKDLMEGKVISTTPYQERLSDNVIKAATKIHQEIQAKNNEFFLKHIFNPSKKYIQKILSLPNYGDYIIPFLAEKKPAELAYLYKLASKKDKNNEIRIPGICFPYFSAIPMERLKMLEPIITSKNYLGRWNYIPRFIADLDLYSDKQLELMTKLAKYKFNSYDMHQIALRPFIKEWEKVLEKSETLHKLYGKNLMESGLYVDNNKLYICAKIGLPQNSKAQNFENYKEVYANIDLELNQKGTKTKENIDSVIETISKNIKTKLSIFTRKDMDEVGINIQNAIPSTNAEEILLTMQKLTQFANYSSLKNIAKELQNLNIGKIPAIGDINPIFNYLCSAKKLCPLSNTPNTNYAYFITKKDLENKKEMDFLKQWLKQGEMKNIKFINLEGWSDGVNLLSDDKGLEEKAKKVILKAHKLMAKDKYLTFRDAIDKVLNNHIETTMKNLGADITTIGSDAPATETVILGQMKPDYPSTGIVKSTIQAIAKNYAPDEKAQKELSERLAKYFDANLDVYSKQSIIDNLKIIHSKIDKYLQENNLPKENVYLITPPKNIARKSFELITKMYSELYNMPEEKIIPIKNIYQLNACPKNSTFVVLDDIVGTGKSMASIGEYAFYGHTIAPDKHILFAPISGTDFGIEYIRNSISSVNRLGKDKVIYIDKNIKQPVNLKKVFKNLYSKINSEKHMYGTDGYDNSCQCIAFPYMTPDNNSVIANDITKYFVANYNCIKNPNIDMQKIEKDAYFTNLFGTKNN